MHVEQKYLAWMIVRILLFVNGSLPPSFFSFLTTFLISVLT